MLIVDEPLRQFVHLFFDRPSFVKFFRSLLVHGHEIDGVFEISHVDLPRLVFLAIENISVLPVRLADLEPERVEQEEKFMRAQKSAVLLLLCVDVSIREIVPIAHRWLLFAS